MIKRAYLTLQRRFTQHTSRILTTGKCQLKQSRIAIVGGGLAGLVAAWRLVQQGVRDVVLLEARTTLGGRIEIAAETVADGGLALVVTDTGAGIAPERLAMITVPFNSSADKMVNSGGGTGLGLAITKGLLERHGGTLEIVSRLGEGTSVRLVFPADRRAA